MLRTTHTYAVLDISPEAYREIHEKLEAAGYQHAFHRQGDRVVIDMHGIALARVELPQTEAAKMSEGWRRVEDEMPKSGVPVLAYLVNRLGKGRCIRASYAATKTLELSYDSDDEDGVYDEETDTYYCSEGWYESNEYEAIHWKVDGVTHWMPLPEGPRA
jgi:hypothetical protein